MAVLVVAETHVPDIVSTLSEAVPYLSALIESDEAYMQSSFVGLRESILHLCNQLNLCKGHFKDEADWERLLLRARISASQTFSLVYFLQNSPLGSRSIFCSCASANANSERLEKLQRQSDETQRLADDFSTFLRRQGTTSDQQHKQELENLRASSAGVSKLELVTPRNLDYKIKNGKKVPFTVTDSSRIPVYTATTWLNNSKSWFDTARRLSASLDNATAGMYEIRHPEEKQSISGRKEQKAFIFSGGFLHGTVTSFLREKGGRRRPSGSLLLSEHFETRGDPGTYVKQRYDVLLVFSHMNILGRPQ